MQKWLSLSLVLFSINSFANSNQSTCDIRVEYNKNGETFFSLYKNEDRVFFSRDISKTNEQLDKMTRISCRQKNNNCIIVQSPNKSSATVLQKANNQENVYTIVPFNLIGSMDTRICQFSHKSDILDLVEGDNVTQAKKTSITINSESGRKLYSLAKNEQSDKSINVYRVYWALKKYDYSLLNSAELDFVLSSIP